VELLVEGKSSRVVGIRGGQIIDDDIDEALAMPRKFDKGLYEIARSLSK
jgi:6-phosphofructokinase 1